MTVMSTEMTVPDAPAPQSRPVMPPAISNLLACWWLAIGFLVLLLVLLSPDMPLPGALGGVRTGILQALIALLVIVGCVIGWQVAQARPTGLRAVKMALLIGMVVWLLIVGIYFVTKMRTGEPSPGGEHPPL